jgi:hypothetical protein
VKNCFVCALALVSWLAVAAPAAGQDHITVDLTSVVADVSRKPIGINVNFLLDADGNRANAIRRLAEALKSAGVRYLRYPGGEKSDAYLWAVPPYTSSMPTLARWAATRPGSRITTAARRRRTTHAICSSFRTS